MLDKKEAMARLEAIEAEAKKLREIIEEPEQAEPWEPKKPTLCWVWDDDTRTDWRAIDVIEDRRDGVYFDRGCGYWNHAVPLTRAEALAMVDDSKASLYEWDRIPGWVKWVAKDKWGCCRGYKSAPTPYLESGRWISRDGDWLMDDGDGEECAEWLSSLEPRP